MVGRDGPKEFFSDLDDKPAERQRVDHIYHLGWQRLNLFPKPTIAMVNGFCFGGAFTRLIMCDLAIAADEATFGLSETHPDPRSSRSRSCPQARFETTLTYLPDTPWRPSGGDRGCRG